MSIFNNDGQFDKVKTTDVHSGLNAKKNSTMNQEDVERYLLDISFRELMCEIERRHLEVINDCLENENDVKASVEEEFEMLKSRYLNISIDWDEDTGCPNITVNYRRKFDNVLTFIELDDLCKDYRDIEEELRLSKLKNESLQHSLNEALKRENDLKEKHLKHLDVQRELSSKIMTLKTEKNSMLATIDNLRQHKKELEEKIEHKNIQTKKLSDILKRQRETIENFIKNGGLDIDA